MITIHIYIFLYKIIIPASTAIFSPIPGSEKSKSIEAGCPTEAQCELSDSQVWETDGTELHPQTGINVQIEDIQRTMPVPLSEIAKAGLNSCKTTDNVLKFIVDNEGDSSSSISKFKISLTRCHGPRSVK